MNQIINELARLDKGPEKSGKALCRNTSVEKAFLLEFYTYLCVYLFNLFLAYIY